MARAAGASSRHFVSRTSKGGCSACSTLFPCHLRFCSIGVRLPSPASQPHSSIGRCGGASEGPRHRLAIAVRAGFWSHKVQAKQPGALLRMASPPTLPGSSAGVERGWSKSSKGVCGVLGGGVFDGRGGKGAKNSSAYGSMRGGPCQGFVGEGGSSTAGQYHSADFPWESRVEEGEAALARQLAELREWKEQHRAQHHPSVGQHPEGRPEKQDQGQRKKGSPLPTWQQGRGQQGQHQAAPNQDVRQCSSEGRGTRSDTAVKAVANHKDNSLQAGGVSPATDYDRSSWESFHSQHSQARFFKERRYLLLEFPQLAVTDPPQHFVEVGCGCGSSLLPILRSNPTCRVTGCDISPTAVRLFLDASKQCGIQPERVAAFAFDAAEAAHPLTSTAGCSTALSPLAGIGADAALLIFSLSALPQHEMPAMLHHAWAALRPGGQLLFRDYGLYDMAQLRFHGSQMLDSNLYQRGDGTLAYFFSLDTIAQLAANVGFEVVESEYACTALHNRKQGAQDMMRVFVHAVFRKVCKTTSSHHSKLQS